MTQLVVRLGNLELEVRQHVRPRSVVQPTTDWGLVPELEERLLAALAADTRPALRVVAG